MLELFFLMTAASLAKGAVWYMIRLFVGGITIYEYQSGIRFKRGRSESGLIGPGRYTYFKALTRIEVFDMRTAILQVSGQEVLTADLLGVKISFGVHFQILDPKALLSHFEDYHESFRLMAQYKLREVIASSRLDTLLGNRKEISENMLNLLREEPILSPLSIQSVNLKDIMLPGDLKKAYLEEKKAQKAAQAALEKARGETAVLRSLANAARLLENNPGLEQLRLIQTIESSEGNTFVLDTK
ncbi:SPFH domain-containing protein [Peribacillus sp. SCS-37]|uniref:SPFH domain-containing protein n=1 Tax=Paraperibacillus esterisolvens TaxID=3115296 RepID=UPI003905EDE9